VTGLSLKLALFRKEGLRQSKSRFLVNIEVLSCRSDQKDSSRGRWRTFHVQSPSRLGKAQLYLASCQSVEPPIPAGTHLLRKSSQIQGFIARIQAEPGDQIAGDYCDLLSRRVKEWQSHRGISRWQMRFSRARRRFVSAGDRDIGRINATTARAEFRAEFQK
jgi:hypothetical protein